MPRRVAIGFTDDRVPADAFNDIGQLTGAAVRRVELLVAADRIEYQFTATDPTTWTTPWSAEVPMIQTDGKLFEYTCHEGNYGLVNTLRGARVADKKAAETRPQSESPR